MNRERNINIMFALLVPIYNVLTFSFTIVYYGLLRPR